MLVDISGYIYHQVPMLADISTRYTYVYCIRSELFIKYKLKLKPASPATSCFSRFVTFRIIPSNMHRLELYAREIRMSPLDSFCNKGNAVHKNSPYFHRGCYVAIELNRFCTHAVHMFPTNMKDHAKILICVSHKR